MSDFLKHLQHLLILLLLSYPIVILVLFLFQRSLLYYPTTEMPSRHQLEAETLHMWPSPMAYRGLTHAVDGDQSRGTVIIFHGNAGAAWHRSFYTKALSLRNFRVILAERNFNRKNFNRKKF